MFSRVVWRRSVSSSYHQPICIVSAIWGDILKCRVVMISQSATKKKKKYRTTLDLSFCQLFLYTADVYSCKSSTDVFNLNLTLNSYLAFSFSYPLSLSLLVYQIVSTSITLLLRTDWRRRLFFMSHLCSGESVCTSLDWWWWWWWWWCLLWLCVLAVSYQQMLNAPLCNG